MSDPEEKSNQSFSKNLYMNLAKCPFHSRADVQLDLFERGWY